VPTVAVAAAVAVDIEAVAAGIEVAAVVDTRQAVAAASEVQMAVVVAA